MSDPSASPPFAGRVAFVTGAARGQGRSHAIALARAGATVVACDIADQIASVQYAMSTPDDLDETVAAIAASGGTGRVLDVRDGVAVRRAVAETVERYGRLDFLVANAGVSDMRPVQDIDEECWADVIGVNLTGAFHCIQSALVPMRRQRFGRIVAISSGAGRAGMRTLSHYGASKWGLIGLVKAVALEVARDGITANVVCPTTVRTPMVTNDSSYRMFRPDLAAPGETDVVPVLEGMSPMGEAWLEPEDVTRAVLYLLADRGVTSGAVLDVNLGTSAART